MRASAWVAVIATAAARSALSSPRACARLWLTSACSRRSAGVLIRDGVVWCHLGAIAAQVAPNNPVPDEDAAPDEDSCKQLVIPLYTYQQLDLENLFDRDLDFRYSMDKAGNNTSRIDDCCPVGRRAGCALRTRPCTPREVRYMRIDKLAVTSREGPADCYGYRQRRAGGRGGAHSPAGRAARRRRAQHLRHHRAHRRRPGAARSRHAGGNR